MNQELHVCVVILENNKVGDAENNKVGDAGLNNYKELEKELENSIKNYIRYMLSLANKVLVKNWEEFRNFITSNTKGDIENCNAVLFLTFEKVPWGDEFNSIYNKSRTLRMFVENTMKAALTANYRNILIKLKELGIIMGNTERENGNTIERVENLNQLKNEFKNIKEKIDEAICWINKNWLNKNSQSFQNIKEKIDEVICWINKNWLNKNSQSFQVDFDYILDRYTHQSFHSSQISGASGHATIRDEIEKVKTSKELNEIGKSRVNLFREHLAYDLSMCLAWNPKRLKNLKILVIDDNPKNLYKDLTLIKSLLGENCEIYLTAENEWKKFLDKEFWKELYNEEGKLSVYKVHNNEINKKDEEKQNNQSSTKLNFFENKKFLFTHIIIDLLLGDYNEGNKVIREFVKLRNAINRGEKGKDRPAFFDIIALSLSTDIEDIQRALEEGAITYVFKERIFQLPAVISILEEYREKLYEREETLLAKSRNFAKLYRLPERIKRKLQTEPFLIPVEDEKLRPIAKSVAYNWIKQIPKAELHFHLGGAMDADTVFHLSLNVLRHAYEKVNENQKADKILKYYINIFGHYFMKYFGNIEEKNYELNIVDLFNKFQIDILETFKKCNEIKNKIKDFYNELIYKDRIEEEKIILAWLFEKFSTFNLNYWEEIISKSSPEELFFEYIIFLTKKLYPQFLLKEFEIISLFNLLVGLIDGKDENDIENFWEKWKKIIKDITENKIKNETLKELVEKIKKKTGKDFEIINEEETEELKITYELKKIFNKIKTLCNNSSNNNENSQEEIEIRVQEVKKLDNELLNQLKSIKNEFSSKNLLRDLLSAFSRGDGKDLDTYLRGGAFSGSTQLQYYENIVIAVGEIVENLLKDKVRYVEIRCSPSGYTKAGKLTLQESIQALFDGADLISLYKYINEGEYIQVNFIISGKRHKSPDLLSREIAIAITNREREIEKEKINILSQKLKGNLYKWYPSRIVGFDLAGLEKGSNLKEYVEPFYPLFHTCFFITIHAGEEETAQYIWDAVYKLHAHRIGHGLKLAEHEFLLNLARDLNIGIELCPISNIYTNPSIKYRYPLFNYIKEGVQCTISTDDPVYSQSDLSKEYVEAAELYYNSDRNKKKVFLTKWEVLRLVKNSFKFAFLEKDRKRELLRSVEEEVYQVILNTEEVEKKYEMDE